MHTSQNAFDLLYAKMLVSFMRTFKVGSVQVDEPMN